MHLFHGFPRRCIQPHWRNNTTQGEQTHESTEIYEDLPLKTGYSEQKSLLRFWNNSRFTEMRITQNPNSEITRRASSSAVITLEMTHSNQLPRQLPWFTKGFNELVARRIIERQFFFALLYPLRPSFVSLSFVQYHFADISVSGTRYALQLHRTCIVSSRFPLTDLPIYRDSTRKGPTLPGEQQAVRRLFSPKLRPRVEHLPSRVPLGTRRRRFATSNPHPLCRDDSSHHRVRVAEGKGGLNTSVERTPHRMNPSNDDDRETKMTVVGGTISPTYVRFGLSCFRRPRRQSFAK